MTTTPHIAIVLTIEGRPCVRVNADTEEQERRLNDWLHASGYWARLVDLALEIANEGREAA
jgi:hypothetical protein